ncbi:MAG TPA: ankyrin repeat domain-containing protein [Anaerovoracaceae bacterium]|nr:ankyrin repeat domain-containing protein [Anaerovoracaceae bacterium]
MIPLLRKLQKPVQVLSWKSFVLGMFYNASIMALRVIGHPITIESYILTGILSLFAFMVVVLNFPLLVARFAEKEPVEKLSREERKILEEKKAHQDKLNDRLKNSINHENFSLMVDLLAQGADPKSITSFSSFMFNIDKLEVLLRYGMPINLQDYNGKTLLHVAAQHGFMDIAAHLLENGADSSIEDRKTYTALELAEDRHLDEPNYQEMVDLLKAHREKNTLEVVIAEPKQEQPKRKNKI